MRSFCHFYCNDALRAVIRKDRNGAHRITIRGAYPDGDIIIDLPPRVTVDYTDDTQEVEGVDSAANRRVS